MNEFDELYFKNYKSNGVINVHDTRKPKLALKHINKLKKIQAVRKMDNIKRQELLSVMYGVPGEESGL